MKNFTIALLMVLFSIIQAHAFQMAATILHLYPASDPAIDFRVDNGETGGILKYWNPSLGPQPSLEILEAAWPAAELAQAKRLKITKVKEEGLSRIQEILPGIVDFDQLQLVREMILSVAPASRQLTGNIQSASDTYQAGSDEVVVLNGYTSVGSVNAFDVVNDPSWP